MKRYSYDRRIVKGSAPETTEQLEAFLKKLGVNPSDPQGDHCFDALMDAYVDPLWHLLEKHIAEAFKRGDTKDIKPFGLRKSLGGQTRDGWIDVDYMENFIVTWEIKVPHPDLRIAFVDAVNKYFPERFFPADIARFADDFDLSATIHDYFDTPKYRYTQKTIDEMLEVFRENVEVTAHRGEQVYVDDVIYDDDFEIDGSDVTKSGNGYMIEATSSWQVKPRTLDLEGRSIRLQ